MHFKRFQNRKSHPLIQYWPLLKSWAPKIENWVHADMFCSIICDMQTEAPELVMLEIKKWSQSKSNWKRRMAIISTLYNYNPKRYTPPFKDIVALFEDYLEVDHYYLQKAIGWSLRELSTAYPEESWKFVDENLLRISPVAFSTAMERIPMKKREPLKERRKAARRKSR